MDKHVYYQHELADGWLHNSMRNDWRWCPRYFKLRYMEGESTPQSEVMEMGEYFHEFARIWHRSVKIYEFEEFNLLSELIAWQLGTIPEDTMPILKMYIERFLVFECRRYWYYARTLATADTEFIPRYTEVELRHRHPGEVYGRAGTIDALFAYQRGGNTIIRLREYKVSRRSGGDFLSGVRGQLTFYKDLVNRTELLGGDMSFRFELYNPLMDTSVFPLEPGTFTKTNKGVHTPFWFIEHPLGATQTALTKSMASFIEALDSDYFPKQPRKNIHYRCVYCAFYSICWGRY